MPRGIAKANAYYNNLQAWDDWRWLVAYAERHGKGDAAKRLQPPDGAGYRKVDRAIDALMKELDAKMPFYELRKANS